MKEMLVQSGTHGQDDREHATWYRALALTERITPLQKTDSSPIPSTDSEQAQRRLLRWKEQPAFEQEEIFVERLAADALTEDDLLTLLAEPMETVQARISSPPLWLTELLSAFRDSHAADNLTLPLLEQGFDPNHLAFLNIIKPLLKQSITRLQSSIQELARQHAHLPFDPDTIMPHLITPVIGLLLTRMVRTAVLELNVARVQGRLHGEMPEERFRDFIRQSAQGDGIPPLLQEYTVLTRQLIEALDSWHTREMELLGRLCNDWEAIRTTFKPDNDPGLLVGIHEGAGDTHRGGRSVTLLTWSSGFRLVYKPRSMSIDLHFQELLAWLNSQGQQPPFQTFKVLDRGAYGWAEFLYARTCTSQEELERFYQRQGSYLALLYALEATDFHSENLIAAGEHPMLIDLESLFHPRVNISTDDKIGLPGFETMGYSVQRVGLLPQRIWAGADNEGIDISGMGGQAGQLMPTPTPMWTQIGTDQMHLTHERTEFNVGHHRPTLQGQEIDTLGYCNAIVTGFEATYRLLMRHRQQLLTQFLPGFKHDSIRFLLRHTRTYATLLMDSFHPNVLRDALDRDRLLDRLWLGVESQPYLRRVIGAEQADLRRGDIPMFTGRVDSYDLFTSDGEQIADFFEDSGLDLVKKRIQMLDEDDLERQIWVIRGSFTTTILGTDDASHKTLQLQPPEKAVTRERLLNAAKAVGDRLSKLALASKEAVGWLGVNAAKEREWQLMAAEEDLYGGVSGIALFLAYLGAITGEERYTALARSTLPTIRHMLAMRKKYEQFPGIGIFNGTGSVIYLLSHLGTLWHEPELYTEAEELVRQLPKAIAIDKGFDVIGGSAGCIAALLSLLQVASSDTPLFHAALCGDHLLACAETMEHGIGWRSPSGDTPLTGFAHGNAGIALNLLRLFEICGEERFRRGALAAIEYERSLFSAKHRNWPDLRVDTSSGKKGDPHLPDEEKYMVAWCHGAPGIGLARLGSLKVLDDDAIRAEIDAALATTLAMGFGMNHSLCHGDMGNLDTLLLAAQVLDKPEDRKRIDNIAAMLLDTIDRQGWVTGVPLGVETPGLMVGLAGTGYALLRLAEPEKVPSVLLGEPPRKPE